MRKVAVVFLLLAAFEAGAKESPAEGRAKTLACGVNISRWFWLADPKNPRENPARFSDQEFAALKKLGFTCVRLPVDFWRLFDSQAPDSLNSVTTDQVVEGVKRLRSAGLAVIVDIHNLIEDEHGREIGACLEKDDAWVVASLNVISALAARLHAQKDPGGIFLELLNEPIFQDDPSRWNNNILPRAIEAARTAAPDTTLIVNANEWAGAQNLLELPSFNDDNLIYGFHFYDPMIFTHQGSPWSGRTDLRQVPYPPDEAGVARAKRQSATKWQADLREYQAAGWPPSRISVLLEDAIWWAAQRKAPLVCTEFGVYEPAVPPADRLRWISDVRETLEKHGIGWMIWSYDEEGFALVERHADGGVKPRPETIKALLP